MYIILSFQTDVPRAKTVWHELRKHFPTWTRLLRGTEDELAEVLRPGGLHRQKAAAIRQLLRQVRSSTGRLSLDSLRVLDDDAAERALTKLHGLSWKGARCVLMYSLRRNAFPIDVNAFRILKRLGAIPAGSVYRRKSLHDAVQARVPEGARKSLHINLVVHGQEVCTPRSPACSSCAIAPLCRRVGVDDAA